MAANGEPPQGRASMRPGVLPGASEQSEQPAAPEVFREAVAQLRGAELRSELVIEEVPAPHRVAPYSAAITADVVVDDDELATGRLVLLHDPEGHEAWHGTFRCVLYARAEIDADMVTDPLLAKVGWSWLLEALETESALYDAVSGTVTRVASESFGSMADEPARAEIELRASWTPADLAIDRHTRAWGTLLCTAAGLPPVPSGVVALPTSKSR